MDCCLRAGCPARAAHLSSSARFTARSISRRCCQVGRRTSLPRTTNTNATCVRLRPRRTSLRRSLPFRFQSPGWALRTSHRLLPSISSPNRRAIHPRFRAHRLNSPESSQLASARYLFGVRHSVHAIGGNHAQESSRAPQRASKLILELAIGRRPNWAFGKTLLIQPDAATPHPAARTAGPAGPCA